MQSAFPIPATIHPKAASKSAERTGENPAEQPDFKDVFDADAPTDTDAPDNAPERNLIEDAHDETDDSAAVSMLGQPVDIAEDTGGLGVTGREHRTPATAESDVSELDVGHPSLLRNAVAKAMSGVNGEAKMKGAEKDMTAPIDRAAKAPLVQPPGGPVLPETASAAAVAAHDRAHGLGRQRDFMMTTGRRPVDRTPAPGVSGAPVRSMFEAGSGAKEPVEPEVDSLARVEFRSQPNAAVRKASHPTEPVPQGRAAPLEFVSTSAAHLASPPETAIPDRLFSDLFPPAETRGAGRTEFPAMQSHSVAVDRTAPMRGIAAQLVEMVRIQDNGSAELRLHPEELGHIRLHFTPSETGHGLSVTIGADKPDTLDLVRRNIQDLAALLAEAGYDSVSFDFGQSGERDPGSGRQKQAHAQGATDLDNAQLQRPARPDAATSGIDIRI